MAVFSKMISINRNPEVDLDQHNWNTSRCQWHPTRVCEKRMRSEINMAVTETTTDFWEFRNFQSRQRNTMLLFFKIEGIAVPWKHKQDIAPKTLVRYYTTAGPHITKKKKNNIPYRSNFCNQAWHKQVQRRR
jgi:hypothetical protein